MTDFNPSFGYLPTSFGAPQHILLNARYPAVLAGWEPSPADFDKALPVPFKYRAKEQNQGNSPECVGYSGGWNQSIAALIHTYDKVFSGHWLYQQACKIGNTNNGAYIWAACDALRKLGHVELKNGVVQPVDLEDGIKSYVWAQKPIDFADGIWNGQVCWFGTVWKTKMIRPRLIDDEHWIGTEPNQGVDEGGHAYAVFRASTRTKYYKGKMAYAMTNTWGLNFPEFVWMTDEFAKELVFDQGGECAFTLDKYVDPIAPPPPPTGETFSVVMTDDKTGKKYSGKIASV